MKTAGIIAEYNPFHNGHKYQIERIKENCDAVVAVMSGGFVQRGDAGIADKRTRARAAVMGGCDLVIELPVCYALNTAQIFARGAVSLLEKTGVIDYLCFGSENDDVSKLQSAANMLLNESDEISQTIQVLLADGMSYPKARQISYEGVIDADILNMPNNILALEYIQALILSDSKIAPVAIKRQGAEHDTDNVYGSFASASHIRKLMLSSSDYSAFVPKDIYELYQNSDIPYDISRIDALITGILRMTEPDALKKIAGVSEGIENRIISAAKNTSGFYELCEEIKTKRYTMSKIRRIILSAVLGIRETYDISYIRVLAMNDTGRRLLREMKEKSKLPIITKTSLYKENNPSLALDFKADDIHSLCSPLKNMRYALKDYTISPFIL